MDRYITNLIHGFYGEIRGDIDKFMAFTGRYGEISINSWLLSGDTGRYQGFVAFTR